MQSPAPGRRIVAPPAAALVALLSLAIAVPTSAAAGPGEPAPSGTSAAPPSAAPPTGAALPTGWTLDRARRELIWTPATRLRTTDARVRITLDGRVLRTAVPPGGRRVVAALSREQLARLDRAVAEPHGGAGAPLAVVAGGRRLDAAAGAGAARPAPTGPQTVSPTASPAAKTTKRTTRKATRTTAPTHTSGPTGTPAPTRTLTGADDPGRPGTAATRTAEYDLEGVRLDGMAQPVEMRALVVTPQVADPAARRPLALFLHGRHESCYAVTSQAEGAPDHSDAWPCPSGWKPVPSHRGYQDYQRTLASQGWITVSVSADGINAQDWAADDGGAQARSALVRAHLARWAQWSASDAAWAAAPDAVREGPRPDLSRVLLVGHSRGGEGVSRAALDSAVPDDGVPVAWRVRGLVLLAPTAFGRDPAPGVPLVVLLPTCDGDLSDLQGQSYLDDARDLGADPALRTAVLVRGANHNFFNTEWTPGTASSPSVDDAGSGTTACGPGRPGRLDAPRQLQVGVTYTAAAARAFVGQDPTALSLLDGSPVIAESLVGVSAQTQTLGGGRSAVLTPSATSAPGGAAPGTALTVTACRTSATDETDADACRRYDDSPVAPSFVPAEVRGQPSRWALRLTWSSSGAVGELPLGATAPGTVGLGTATAVAARLVVPAGSPVARLDAALVDAGGRALPLGRLAVQGLSRMGAQKATWLPDKDVTVEVRAQIDRAAAAAAGVDLTRLRGLRLTSATSTGRLWLLDAWAVPAASTSGSAGTPFVLPRLDVGTARVFEGDTARDVVLPVTVRGPASAGRVWFLVRDGDWTPTLVGPVDVPAGVTSLSVRVPLAGDTRDDVDEQDILVQAGSLRGVAPARYTGRVTVVDDDESPPVVVTPSATATEKDTLTWTFRVDGDSDAPLALPVTLSPLAAEEAPLSVEDLDTKWAKKAGLDVRADLPLAQSGLSFVVALSAERPSTLSIKLRPDTATEPTETVRLRVAPDTAAARPDGSGAWVRGLPDGAQLIGSVTD